MATNLERIAILETKLTSTEIKLTSIEEKLDQLLELKSKGMGALGLASLVIGSGALGIIWMIVNFFRGNHL